MAPGQLATILQLGAQHIFIAIAPLIITAHAFIAAEKRQHAPGDIALSKYAVGLPGQDAFFAERGVAAVVKMPFIKSGIAPQPRSIVGIAEVRILALTRVRNKIPIVPVHIDAEARAEYRGPLRSAFNFGQIVAVHLIGILGGQ